MICSEGASLRRRYDLTDADHYKQSSSTLAVYTKDLQTCLGEADFDLAKYANDERAQEDRLPLKNCTIDPQAYIEIFIRARMLESTSSTPRVPHRPNQLNSMPTIEERESESDIKEEFERKEKEYLRQIERLEDTLEGLRRTYDE